jgi:hypothetical protein
MSDLFAAAEILTMAKDIVGNNGPIKIDMGIYSHNITMDDSEKGEDITVLGSEKENITLVELADFFVKLDALVNDLEDDTGRTYGFDGIRKEEDKSFSIIWGS